MQSQMIKVHLKKQNVLYFVQFYYILELILITPNVILTQISFQEKNGSCHLVCIYFLFTSTVPTEDVQNMFDPFYNNFSVN